MSLSIELFGMNAFEEFFKVAMHNRNGRKRIEPFYFLIHENSEMIFLNFVTAVAFDIFQIINNSLSQRRL